MNTVKGTCAYCGKDFEYEKQSNRLRKYCCVSCSRNAQAASAYKRNPERFSEYNSKGKIAYEVAKRYDCRCALCGWRVSENLVESHGRLQKAYGNEVHHIIAVQDGGTSAWGNLILLCPNHHKQANLGLIPIKELQDHVLPQWTDEEKARIRSEASCKCVERIVNAIFGEQED